MYGSCTLITVYGSHISIPHVFSYRVCHTFFSHDFPHVTHVNHLGIYTGILYLSHKNHIGMLYRNHMFQDTHMWKLLTCGGDITVASIQLLCGYHTTPVWLPYRELLLCITWELYGSHMLPYTIVMCRGFLPYSSHMATIQLSCGYHTASV